MSKCKFARDTNLYISMLTILFGCLVHSLWVGRLPRIVHWAGESFYLYLWGFCQALMLAMMWIYPNIIQPIFNKFEPLKEAWIILSDPLRFDYLIL